MSIENYIKTIKSVTELPKVEKEGKKPRILIVDGDIEKIFVSQSLIRKLVYKGDKVEQCWLKIWHTEILRDMDTPQTKSMTYGRYFETECIGGTAYDEPIEMPKSKRDGSKLIDEVRIDEQIFLFKNSLDKYSFILNEQADGTVKNAQIRESKKIDLEGFEGIDIYLEGTADFLSPIAFEKYVHDTAVIDLKLTLDRFAVHGYYTWGNLEHMDHIQGTVYHVLFGMPFFYWVFDYNSKDRGERLIPVITDVEHPEKEKAIEARLRLKQMYQSIRFVCSDIISYFMNPDATDPQGQPFWIKPEYHRCKNCPVNCDVKETIQEA